MGNFIDISPAAQHTVNVILLWVGFGAVVGMIVRGLIPGKEPSGPLSTFLIGISGSCAGPLILMKVWPEEKFNPISPLGFGAALLSALVFLIVTKIVIYLGRALRNGLANDRK